MSVVSLDSWDENINLEVSGGSDIYLTSVPDEPSLDTVCFILKDFKHFLKYHLSLLCFSLHFRSTMVAADMFVLILTLLVFPCASLEGKSPPTKTSHLTFK